MRAFSTREDANMPLHLSSTDLVIRLLCTLIAGAIIGYNRGERGKAAGLRTTMLVCLAASVAMLQVNLLLPLAGRPSDSFVMNDLMRLPLGILTGVGFIGGGAILRRGDMVTGVTTAATLWFVTVVGLCFGGGQILIGAIATTLGTVVLWGFDWFDHRMRAEFRGRLTVMLGDGSPAESAIRQQLRDARLAIRSTTAEIEAQCRSYVYEVSENRTAADAGVPAVVDALARQPGVSAVSWRPVS
jgi:putative Mg2+ transporter-C (MgtC) family protein